MELEDSFEAKLQEYLEEVQAGAAAAKERVARGIAGLQPTEPNPPAAPVEEPTPPSKHAGPAVSFDEVDDEGIPVWEEPA